MKNLNMYAYYDMKSQVYDTPFFAFHDINAERNFIMTVQKNDTMLARFKDEMQLYKIGEFDKESGKINSFDFNILIMDGKQIDIKENEDA